MSGPRARVEERLPSFTPLSGGWKGPSRRAARAGLRSASAVTARAQSAQLRTRSAWLRPRSPAAPGCSADAPAAGLAVNPPGSRSRPGGARGAGAPPPRSRESARLTAAAAARGSRRAARAGSPPPPLRLQLAPTGAGPAASPTLPGRCALGRCAAIGASHGSFSSRGCGRSGAQQRPAQSPRPGPSQLRLGSSRRCAALL